MKKMRLWWCMHKTHLEMSMERLGWETAKDGEHSDFYWHDLQYHPTVYQHETQPYWLNKIPGILELCKKVKFSKLLKQMQEHQPKEFDFYPKSWSLPAEYEKFEKEYRSKQDNSGQHKQIYIYKPDDGSLGEGIFLSNKLPDSNFTEENSYVVQEYIDPPLLLDGYKFDLRLYVLIAKTDPPEIYLCENGLVRLCTKKYEPPCKDNLQDTYMHLSNYSLNIHSKSFEKTKSLDTGSKRTWIQVKKALSASGHDVELAVKLIKDLSTKTVLLMLKDLENLHKEEELKYANCFHIIGVDVMFSSSMKPYLIEINSSPSFRVNQRLDPEVKESETYIEPVDEQVKISLITDTLRLLSMGENNMDMSSSCLERIHPVFKT